MFKRKSLVLLVSLMVLSMIGLTACNSTKVTDEDTLEDIESLTIIHELGEATIANKPKKVIVFDYATLDSLNQMDVEIIGLPKSNIPSYLGKYNADKYEDVGTLFEPNFEKIYELKPDLILISGRQREVYDDLNDIAPTVYLAIDTDDYVGSLASNLRVLGEIFDEEEYVNQEINNIETKIMELSSEVVKNNKNALIIMANDGALSVYGKNSRFNVIHKEFAFPAADEKIEVSNHGQSISFEYIAEVNPDIIFVIDRAAVTGGNGAAEQILDNDLVKMTNAYKNDAINYLNAHIWYVASGGLQGTNIMIEEVTAAMQ